MGPSRGALAILLHSAFLASCPIIRVSVLLAETFPGSAKPANHTNSMNGTKHEEHEEHEEPEYVDATVEEIDPEGELVALETEAT